MNLIHALTAALLTLATTASAAPQLPPPLDTVTGLVGGLPVVGGLVGGSPPVKS